MAMLCVNHANMAASEERRNEIYSMASEICERALSQSKDRIDIAKAQITMALCQIALGEAQKALDLLGGEIELRLAPQSLIAQSYLMLGDRGKAIEIMQAEMYQNTMGTFGNLISYIQANIKDYAVALAAFKRAVAMCELFGMKGLNPNSVAILRIAGAHMHLLAGKREEALEQLEEYVDVCCCSFFPFKLQGDDFFDRIGGWIEENAGVMPRSEAVVKESMLNDVLMSPMFESLRDCPKFGALAGKLKDFCQRAK
jgi:hypothetical protein